MKAKSIKGSSTEEIQAALTESLGDGFSPALAIVFISKSQDHRGYFKITERWVFPFSEPVPMASSLMAIPKEGESTTFTVYLTYNN